MKKNLFIVLMLLSMKILGFELFFSYRDNTVYDFANYNVKYSENIDLDFDNMPIDWGFTFISNQNLLKNCKLYGEYTLKTYLIKDNTQYLLTVTPKIKILISDNISVDLKHTFRYFIEKGYFDYGFNHELAPDDNVCFNIITGIMNFYIGLNVLFPNTLKIELPISIFSHILRTSFTYTGFFKGNLTFLFFDGILFDFPYLKQLFTFQYEINMNSLGIKQIIISSYMIWRSKLKFGMSLGIKL